eukprot:TRINITY_DN58988_c0_g1_i1.p1 TRINITY_DN58988_c0_g1~~TRINITY_DN58988_c0_g1_i1.p1  ORF type:complete len:137 (-),score=10.20 TRINITY_DN58988_c0_g1_i1:105-515(-)
MLVGSAPLLNRGTCSLLWYSSSEALAIVRIFCTSPLMTRRIFAARPPAKLARAVWWDWQGKQRRGAHIYLLTMLCVLEQILWHWIPIKARRCRPDPAYQMSPSLKFFLLALLLGSSGHILFALMLGLFGERSASLL